jgi:GAF domain-containing protein
VSAKPTIDLLEMFFERMPMVIAVLDSDLRFLRYNTTCIDFTRIYAPDTAGKLSPGARYFDVYPGSEKEVKPLFKKALSGENVQQEAVTLKTAGMFSYWDLVMMPIYENGQITGILYVSSDATDRISALKALERTLSALKERESQLQRQLEFENIITSISTNFINLEPDEIDSGIVQALNTLGEFTQVDRARVFQFSADGKRMQNSHEWCAPGIPSQHQRMRDVSIGAFAYFTEKIKKLQIVHVPDIENLPSLAKADQAECRLQNMRSLLLVPMAFRSVAIGFVCFESISRPRSWSEDSISLLKIVSEVLVNALEHKRAQAIQAGQRLFLELLASGGSLSETLHSLVRIIEEQYPGIQALVAILDESSRHLLPAASISLEDNFIQMINTLEINLASFSLDNTWLGNQSENVDHTLELLRAFGLRDLARQYGLNTCWSEPIRSSQEKFLGVFAVFSTSQRGPTPSELRTIQISAHLASIAIEHKLSQEELQRAYQTLEQHVDERTRQLTTLLDLSYNLASTIELEPQLGLILDQLASVVEYDGASIFKLEGNILTVVAYRGPIPQEIALTVQYPLELARVNKAVIENRSPIIIADTRSDTPMARDFQATAGDQIDTTFGYIRSWMGVPLIVRGQIIGMLSLDSPIPDYYTQSHSKLALAFANQVAAAIENARLYAEVRQRADEVQTLFAVQQAITSRLEADSVLQMIANEARRLTNTTLSVVALLDEDEAELEAAVISGEVHTPLLGHRQPVDGSIAGLALHDRKPYRIQYAAREMGGYHDMIRITGAQSFIIVPLVSANGAIGTITVADKIAGKLSPDDERVLTMLASGAVVALENAHLYQEEQERRLEADRRREVAEGLRDILNILNSNRPLEEILQNIVRQAMRLTESDAAAIFRNNPEGTALELEAAFTRQDQSDITPIIQPLRGPDSSTQKNRNTYAIDNISEMLETQENFPPEDGRPPRPWLVKISRHFNAYLNIPLLIRDEVYGSLGLFYKNSRQFSEEEIGLALAFSDQAALAIENARLRAQTERAAVAAERSRLARDLHDAVTQTLFSASLIAEVLPRLWDRNPQEGQRRLEELRQLTRGALAEMRALLLELRPAALAEANLGELFRHLAEAFSSRARIPVEFSIQGSLELSAEVKVALYRIAQEALNNVAKHAEASHAALRIVCHLNSISLTIQDDGRGFYPGSIAPEHLGLGIMKERAEFIQAHLQIKSQPDSGTIIEVTWPQE